MITAFKGRVEARQKMFNPVKQVTVKDCMERVEGEAKERFAVVEEFEEEMIEVIICPTTPWPVLSPG